MSKATFVRQTSNPSTPNAGEVAVFVADSTGKLRSIDEGGVVTDYNNGGGGSGDSISVNGSAVTDANFNDALPAAPANGINVQWQQDSTPDPDNISANVATGIPTGLSATGSNVEGAAASVARSDHTHAIATTGGTISTVNAGDTSSEGTGAGFSRRDHQHAVETAAAGTAQIGSAAGEGSGTALARADHVHSFPAPPAPANVTKATASAGVATTFARSDHKHDVATAAPVSIPATTNQQGASTSLARADHVHRLQQLVENLDVNNFNLLLIQLATFKVVNLGNVAGPTQNLDFTAASLYLITLTGNVSLTFTDPPGPARLMIRLDQDGTGNRSITLPSGVITDNGAQPNLSNQAGETNVLTLVYDGAGYIAEVSGDKAAI